jgi:hypothetical protein
MSAQFTGRESDTPTPALSFARLDFSRIGAVQSTRLKIRFESQSTSTHRLKIVPARNHIVNIARATPLRPIAFRFHFGFVQSHPPSEVDSSAPANIAERSQSTFWEFWEICNDLDVAVIDHV